MNKASLAYKKAKSMADQKYGLKTSAYKSGYIVHMYKSLGGKFKGTKPTINKGLKKWYKGEKWIQVIPYLQSGRIVTCGAYSTSKHGKACRPLQRENKSSPITIKELLKIHSKQALIKAARHKEKNPQLILNWKTLSFS